MWPGECFRTVTGCFKTVTSLPYSCNIHVLLSQAETCLKPQYLVYIKEVNVSPIPSIGLSEVLILAGIAALVTLMVAIVVVVIVRSRKRSDPHRPAGAGLHELEVTGRESRGLGKWIVILVLLVLLALPLFALFCGILWVVPIRSTQSMVTPMVQIVAVDAPTATPLPALTASDATPTDAPQPTPTAADTPHSTSMPSGSALSLNPFNRAIFIILPGIAGLVLLIGAAAVAVIVKRWRGSDTQSKDTSVNGDHGGIWARTTKLRYALLAFAFWLALSIFLILDLGFSVSLYFRFVAIYTAFWILVGALLLYGRPMREILLILGLFVMVAFSVRFMDWNSRKPFLKDFYSVKVGMTPAQVEQIIGGYMIGGGAPLGSPKTEINERGEIVTGTATYRHTNEGWGDSDWGVVTFENGRVVKIEFLPD